MYFLSDLLYVIIYHLVGYRRKVVEDNILHSFPNKNEEERRTIERLFYHHLCDIFVEGLLNLVMPLRWIMRRYRVVNPDVPNAYYQQGHSVVLMSAHYNDWEYMITTLDHHLMAHGIGVGKRLSNRLLEPWVYRRRTRYGTQVVYADTVRREVEYYVHHGVPCALMMLSDQSPSDIHKCYWTQFLNQDTPFIYGAEYFARKYNLPVLYYRVDKVRRGYYEVTFSLLCENPQEVPQYTIVERYAHQLEADITDHPEYWLWSHRRWKHKRNH